MNDRDLQLVLAATGDYDGGIDGLFGPKSMRALRDVEARHRAAYTFDPSSTTEARRKTGALQAALIQLGETPGIIDGWWGVNTEEALNAFLFKSAHGRPEQVDRSPDESFAPSGDIPLQSEVGRVYGEPGDQIRGRLKTVRLPVPLRLDWNLRKTVGRATLHRDCADQFCDALSAIEKEYGRDRMQALGIDRYAGGYNHRRMRGGTKWSMHAYGCAVDFYAAPNGLRTRCPQALFCGDDYQPFLDIMQAHEWLPALRLWGADAMHFQRARLR